MLNRSTSCFSKDGSAQAAYASDFDPTFILFQLSSPATTWLAVTVLRRSTDQNIRYTIVSPLAGLVRGYDPIAANEDAAAVATKYDGLLQWVIIDPRFPATYEQATQMLSQATCVGIKIHPEAHQYYIRDHARAIFEFAARHHAIVLTHSGCPHSMPLEMIPFVNEFPEMTLILAHIGNGYDDDHTHQARAIQVSKHDNVIACGSAAARNYYRSCCRRAVSGDTA